MSPVPFFSPKVGGTAPSFLIYRYIALISHGCFLCVLCLFSKFPFYKDTSYIVLKPTLLQYDFLLTNHIYKDLIFQ